MIIMIRKVKAKRKRRNPFLVEYGYHFTNSENLDSIMKHGLVPGFRGSQQLNDIGSDLWYDWLTPDKQKVADYFYNKKSPIYFSDIPDVRNLPETLIQHFKNSDYDRCLKVNVSKLNQLPDLFMLLIDYKFHYSKFKGNEYLSILFASKFKNNKSLTEQLSKYDYELPFDALKHDEELQSELIFLTGTFVVNERIPPKYIEEIIKVK